MKKIFFVIIVSLIAVSVFSQGNSGLGFNYQAIIRGADGFVLPKQNVELRFSLMPGQQATQASWVEIHKTTTDTYGTIGVTVGKGTKSGGVANLFNDVNFAAVHYWMKVEIKEGSNYLELSYTALASVPYAETATNAASSPVGSVMPFAGDADKVPAGWLLCDGREVSRSDYVVLYNVIGTAWGFGNNSTTFNLPDMRGMFLRGLSLDSEMDEGVTKRIPLKEGGNSGNNVGSYQRDALPNITGIIGTNHNYAGAPNFGSSSGAFSPSKAVHGRDSEIGSSSLSRSASFDASRSSAVYGRDDATEAHPKNVGVNYIIKY